MRTFASFRGVLSSVLSSILVARDRIVRARGKNEPEEEKEEASYDARLSMQPTTGEGRGGRGEGRDKASPHPSMRVLGVGHHLTPALSFLYVYICVLASSLWTRGPSILVFY